jgi:cytochrome c-type biogenesis protein CcmH/NrfG
MDRSRQLNPSSNWTWLKLGQYYLRAGDRTRARQTWEAGLKVNPAHKQMLKELARLDAHR